DIDGRTILFTIGLAMLTSVVFGLMPVIRQSGIHHDTLRDGGVSRASGFNLFRTHRLEGALVVVEIATSLMLFIGTGLLVRSFFELVNVKTGYGAKNVLTFRLTMPAGFVDQVSFTEELVRGLETISGQGSVGYAQSLPMVRLLREVRLRRTPGP